MKNNMKMLILALAVAVPGLALAAPAKPSYEELAAKVQALEARQAAQDKIRMAGDPKYASAVADVAPGLGKFMDDVLFGDLWKREELSPRDRSLVTISTLIALNRENELPFHLKRALNNGVTRKEIGEVITHLAFYAGWPNAVTAVRIARKVFAETPQK